jgi:hypothetical protein
MMAWDERLKVSHGATQYASDMRALFEAGGFSVDETRALLIEPFETAAEPYLARLMAGDLDPQVYVYVTSSDSPAFPPIRI